MQYYTNTTPEPLTTQTNRISIPPKNSPRRASRIGDWWRHTYSGVSPQGIKDTAQSFFVYGCN